MDDQEYKMLERLLKISEDNNRILRKMHRLIIFKRMVHLLYWLVIIVLAFVAYYYIKPYISNISSSLTAVDQIRGI